MPRTKILAQFLREHLGDVNFYTAIHWIDQNGQIAEIAYSYNQQDTRLFDNWHRIRNHKTNGTGSKKNTFLNALRSIDKKDIEIIKKNDKKIIFRFLTDEEKPKRPEVVQLDQNRQSFVINGQQYILVAVESSAPPDVPNFSQELLPVAQEKMQVCYNGTQPTPVVEDFSIAMDPNLEQLDYGAGSRAPPDALSLIMEELFFESQEVQMQENANHLTPVVEDTSIATDPNPGFLQNPPEEYVPLEAPLTNTLYLDPDTDVTLFSSL